MLFRSRSTKRRFNLARSNVPKQNIKLNNKDIKFLEEKYFKIWIKLSISQLVRQLGHLLLQLLEAQIKEVELNGARIRLAATKKIGI